MVIRPYEQYLMDAIRTFGELKARGPFSRSVTSRWCGFCVRGRRRTAQEIKCEKPFQDEDLWLVFMPWVLAPSNSAACDSPRSRYHERMENTPVPREFVTTHWSLVGAAQPGDANQTRAREALEELCRAYWYPLYAFVRRRGYAAADAQDLTQAFFSRMLETSGFAAADRERGRFRSYLLGAMKHFLANEWHRAQAQKRGGQVQFIAWEALDPEARYAGASEPSDNPEHLFDREWALQTVAEALQALRDEMAKAGKSEQFDALKGSLTGQDESPREDIAARLDMSAGAVKVAVHRLRQRYRTLLRAAIAETVSNEADLDDEMRYLVAVLRRR